MQGKGFKEYLEWLIVGVFILLIIGMGARLTIGQEAEIGVYLNASNSSYTLEQDLLVFNDTGVHTGGIFIDNDTQALFSDLTINAALTVTQTNSTTFTVDNETEISNTLGIFTQGAFSDEMTARPIGNLTITSNGAINVSANGTAVFAGGIAVGNVTDNLINNGTINVSGNVTDSSEQLMVGGVYAINATNVVNNGNLTINGTGGYVDYAENNVPAGFEIASLGNFTNTGNINVSIESINATAVGVRSYEIGYFNNTGNISVFTNSTSGDFSEVIGVMAGKPQEFEGLTSGQISTFINSGNLTVSGYASGTELNVAGVAVFNGTIDNFQNLAGGKIEVYGENISGNATSYGVVAVGDIGNINNFLNSGLINTTAIGSNATAYGVFADDNIVSFTNEVGSMITVTANATNGIALASGVDTGSIGNFTNKGDIYVNAIGSNAYASGVYGSYIGNFTNEGNINAYISSSGDGGVAGVMSGTPPISIFGSPEPGYISSFINSGNLTVTGYSNGGELRAYGVGVFNGTIDNFQNLAGGKIEVYGENTNGQVYAYGVYAENGIGNFTNNGSISVIANGTSSAYASGVEAGDIDSARDIGSFTGNGTIFVSATASNGYAGASGVSAYGNIDDFKLEGGGRITVTASGTAVFAGGIAVGNVTDNLINNGTINVSGNVTDSSEQLMVGGVYAINATNVVNNGNLTINGTGGYVDYAENNVPAGFEIASLGNFTNTGNINVSIESINATAVGVRSYEIGYFNNTGNISVFTNSTSGDFSEVIGVMAGKPQEFEGLTSGQISTFINSGNLTVSGYASGTELYAFGVAVFNGTIDEFQNSAGGRIKVYGENTNGQAGAYGVYAENGIGNFTNVGEINVSVNSNATSENAGVFGVKVGSGSAVDIDNFINSGKISANASSNTTGAIGAYGIYVYGDIENFVFESGGEISANANAEYKVVAYGVVANNIANFISRGSISASANTTNNNAEAYGVYLSESLGNFTLESGGEISANASSTNGNVYAYGVDVVSGGIGNFTNEGTIDITAIATNGNTYAYGVNAGNIGNFSGNGTIFVNAIASNGNAQAYGVSAGNIDDFKLEGGGRITVTANGTGYAEAFGIYQEGGNIGNFTNEGGISVIANGTNYAEAYGIEAGDIGSFTGNGTIFVNATATNGAAWTYGVHAGSIGNFTLVGGGSISVIANAINGAAEAYGIEVDNNINNLVLENGSKINVTAIANATTNGAAEAIGVSGGIDNFTNNSEININAISTNWWAYASGVESGDISIFTNTGNIIASATSTNGAATAYGVIADIIGNFTNAGSIVASANGTNWSEAWGVRVSNSIDSFTNKNNINANAIGNSNVAAYGIETMGNVGNIGNFANEGNIIVNATATVEGAWVAGISVGGGISNFTNEGSIIANANGTSEASALGIYVWNVGIGNFTNEGNINVIASSTNGNATAYGVSAGDVGNFTNNATGVINVTAIAFNGNATAKGVDVDGTISNFINSGSITANSTSTGGDAENTKGVTAYNIDEFFNNGTITAISTATGNADVTGVEIDSNATSFTNAGIITAAATGANATSAGVFVGNATLFTNTKTINVTANATAGKVIAAGVVGSNNLGNFTNEGNITVTSNATSGGIVGGVLAGLPPEIGGGANGTIGIFVNNGNLTVKGYTGGAELHVTGAAVFNGTIDEFQNLGKIEVYGENTNGQAGAYGVYAENGIGNFTNTGTFEITAIATNGTASAYGVSVNNDINEFTMGNDSAIKVIANSSNAHAEAEGIVVNNINNNLSIDGKISATTIGYSAGSYGVDASSSISNLVIGSQGSIKGDAEAYDRAWAYGVYTTNINNFLNTGEINVNATGNNNATSSAVQAYGSIGNFTNAGNIIANATATNVVAEAFGILASDVGNFTNTGTIDIAATATNGTAKAYGLNVGVVDTIGNFTNNGTIKITATGKDAEATGLYAVFLTGTLLNDSSGNIQVSAKGVQSANATGIYVEKAQTGSTILNKGLIDVSAVATSGLVNSVGIYLKDSNTTLTNNGTIKVYASGNVDKVAGIYITNSTVELSNPGEVVVWGNVPSGAKIRTLYVDTGSNVILKDKFAITFGAPGTGPNIAPIYVASGSALNLNSTTLVVRLWNNSAQYIVVNTPYIIIEYNGTVDGNWGGLEKGYINPLIDVTWYNSTITNKDAQIIFKYSALNNPEQALGPVSSITGGVIINSIMVDNVFTFLPITSPLILVKGYQPIMLASSGVSDVGAGYSLGGVEYRGGMWFKPLYTYVDADDLGFDTDAYGFNIGLGGFLTKNFSLGIYANYLRAEYDYSISSAKDGDSDIFSVGIAGMWKMMKDTYLRYNVYGFSSSNDYHGRTGFNFELKEKASYNMNGVHAEILIGKVYRGKLNIIPEIGIKYTYYNPESFWTKVYDSAGNRVSSWDRYYDPDNKHMWKGLVGVMVAGETKAGGIPVNLFAYGRLEQAFGENDISALNYMRSDPTRWEISKEINRTTFIVQLGGEFMLQKNLGLEISGRGDFNGDYSGYTGKVMLRYSW
jgi:hypothetical protein